MSCGYAGDPEKECTCSPTLISRYQKRLSGPSWTASTSTSRSTRAFQKLSDDRRGEPSAAIRGRVEGARAAGGAVCVGAGLPADQGCGWRRQTRPYHHADMGPPRCATTAGWTRRAGSSWGRRCGRCISAPALPPHPEAGAHHRRSGGRGAHPAGAYRGGDPVPARRME